MVFIDLTLHLPGRNHKSSHIRTIFMHRLTSILQTLPNTANNGIKQITKEKTFQLYQCCVNNFLKEIFLLTISFVHCYVCRQFILPKNNAPSLARKTLLERGVSNGI